MARPTPMTPSFASVPRISPSAWRRRPEAISARACSRPLSRRSPTTRAALLIGSDCPALTARHLRQADRALRDGADAVFVPCEDGGYALIGLKRVDARLFDGIAWGGETVMAETRSRLRGLGWRWRELETLWDVDRPEDYQRLLASGLLDGRHATV